MNQHESEELTEVRHLTQRIDRHIGVFIEIENEGNDVEQTKQLRLSELTVDIIKASSLLEYYANFLTKRIK